MWFTILIMRRKMPMMPTMTDATAVMISLGEIYIVVSRIMM